jgi:hypothetical protein
LVIAGVCTLSAGVSRAYFAARNRRNRSMLRERRGEIIMNMSRLGSGRVALLSAILLALAVPLDAAETADTNASAAGAQDTVISPEAQAVVDRMTAYLRTLKTYSIDSQSTRDEVVNFGYKVQHNEHSTVTVQLPNKLRAEVSGDLRDRTVVYDGAKIVVYSPDSDVYARTSAPDSVHQLIGNLLDAGVEMPMVDVLYQTGAGTLTEEVRGGVLVGDSEIDGSDCDHLAFRQQTIDWQLWVEKGDKPVPRKLVITTRYEVGDPQFQSTLRWNLSPKIDASTFTFTPPKDAKEIPFSNPAAINGAAP